MSESWKTQPRGGTERSFSEKKGGRRGVLAVWMEASFKAGRGGYEEG